MVLLAVSDLGAEAYGLGVRRDVAERSGHDYSVGAIYTTLSRLEEKGWISASLADPQPTRGGRSRRQFTITGAGAQALVQARRQAEVLWRPAIGGQPA